MLPPVSSVLSLSSSNFSANSRESPLKIAAEAISSRRILHGKLRDHIGLQHCRRRQLHLIDKILRAEPVPQRIGSICALYLVLRKISGQQRLQHRQAQRLLERADHQKIRSNDPGNTSFCAGPGSIFVRT